MFDLTGKVALVTGSGRGVGAGIAKAYGAQGAAVAVNDFHADRAGAVAAALCEEGVKAISVPFDVTDMAAVEQGIDRIRAELGPVDILVNNAGGVPEGKLPEPFVKTSAADWQPIIDMNLQGTLNCVRAVVDDMLEQKWGRLLAVSSDAARVGHFGSAAYSAAKAATEALMRTLSKELGPKGVTANSLVLGLINTVPEGFADGAESYFATRRIGRPEDIAAGAVYLASEEASWVTGHSLVINGGYLGA